MSNNYSLRFFRKRVAPCKGCTDRIVGCHSQCEQYKAFKDDMKAEQDKTKQAYVGEVAADDYVIKSTVRWRRKR